MASIRKEIHVDAKPDRVWDALRDVGALHERVVWSVVGGRFTHHNASVQVFADGQTKSRLVWIADLLPNDLEPAIRAMIDQAATVMKPTLERA